MSGEQTSASARKREATCDGILDAASQLIAEKGVDGFTMSGVAERGKVNRALIYHYYHDRDNLIFETIRHIVRRYDNVTPAGGGDALEQSIRMHIEHPGIARFFFHLLLTGKPLPRLSQRLLNTITELEKLKAEHAPNSRFDPAMGVIGGWLVQLSWSFARDEIARQLGVSVQEADERLIAHLRYNAEMVRRSYAASG